MVQKKSDNCNCAFLKASKRGKCVHIVQFSFSRSVSKTDYFKVVSIQRNVLMNRPMIQFCWVEYLVWKSAKLMVQFEKGVPIFSSIHIVQFSKSGIMPCCRRWRNLFVLRLGMYYVRRDGYYLCTYISSIGPFKPLIMG